MSDKTRGILHTHHPDFIQFKSEQREKLVKAFPVIAGMEIFLWGGIFFLERIFIRSVFSTGMIFFLLLLIPVKFLIHTRLADTYKRYVNIIHSGTVVFWNTAAAVVSYFLFQYQELWQQAVGASYYIIVMGIFFLGSFSLRSSLPFLTAFPLLFLVTLLMISGDQLSSLNVLVLFPAVVWMMFSITSIVVDRLYYREFLMRLLAERRREQVLQELKHTELLNEQLEETTGSLKKEIEERKTIEKSLEQFAAFDELTSVYNRRAGLEVLKEALHYAERKGQNLTIAFVDLDGLKIVNDNFGHSAGDSYLRTVVALMRKHLRKSDSISRYGGDEFLVILTECSESEARTIFNRIDDDTRLMNQGDRLFSVGFSYGFAETSVDKREGCPELISRADNMMYLNKQKKRHEGPR